MVRKLRELPTFFVFNYRTK
jgi:hypothetical protein